MNNHYFALNNYLKDQFGTKVYKLALNGGMTCPNRDGTVGYKGCIFCSEGGSGEFASDKGLGITEQIEAAKLKVKRKIKKGKYIAYFQAYTNTYAPVDYLERIFLEAISHEDIVALSIATRPDCLGEDVIELLSRLNSIKPVWIELGLQTIHKSSAEYIKRGYDLSCFEDAVRRLRAIGVNVIVHVILGLPNETREQVLQTIKYLGLIGIDGIKLQLLHVLKGTELATLFELGQFRVLAMDEYIDLLGECIENLPPNVVIHRLTGDGPKSLLIEPKWSANKWLVLTAIKNEFALKKIKQGKNYKLEG